MKKILKKLILVMCIVALSTTVLACVCGSQSFAPPAPEPICAVAQSVDQDNDTGDGYVDDEIRAAIDARNTNNVMFFLIAVISAVSLAAVAILVIDIKRKKHNNNQ